MSIVKLQSLHRDDGAVSPVIGVILMVGVTVILSAVVAAFVFSAVDTSEPAPQVSLNYDYEMESSSGAADGTLTLTVASGDVFTADQVEFRGTDLGTDGGDANAGSEWHERAASTTVGPESTIGGGSRAELSGLSDTYELELVWTAGGGGSSAILSTRTGPDA
jgi:FlaG/FlaF family flagellin (archaellin)